MPRHDPDDDKGDRTDDPADDLSPEVEDMARFFFSLNLVL
jgi:hypothetical protein